MPLDKDVDLQKLSEITPGYVGADIDGICREAGMVALRENMDTEEVKLEHFKEAIEKLTPSLSEDDIEKYKQIEKEYLKKARAIITEKPHYLG